MRRALVVALHDGFYSAATGAGLSNQALLAAVAEHLPDGTDLVVAPVNLDPTSPEHDHTAHQRTLATLGQVPHKVIPLSNGTNGQTRFGDLTAFQHLGKDSARVIQDLKRDYDSGAIVAIDRPFVGLGPHCPMTPRGTPSTCHDRPHCTTPTSTTRTGKAVAWSAGCAPERRSEPSAPTCGSSCKTTQSRRTESSMYPTG